MRTTWLTIRMGLCVVLLFAVIYALLSVIAFFAGVGTPIVYALLALVMVSIQFFSDESGYPQASRRNF
jgi:heat shock protein HtpX